MKQKFANALSLALIVAMLVTSLAFADDITPDSDTVVLGDQPSRNLGNVAPGAVLTPTVNFKLVCSGTQHVDDSQSVSITFTLDGSTVPSGGSLSATNAMIGATSGSDLGVPTTWPDDGNNNCNGISSIDDNGDSTVTITAPTTAGTYTYKVKYDATRSLEKRRASAGRSSLSLASRFLHRPKPHPRSLGRTLPISFTARLSAARS